MVNLHPDFTSRQPWQQLDRGGRVERRIPTIPAHHSRIFLIDKKRYFSSDRHHNATQKN